MIRVELQISDHFAEQLRDYARAMDSEDPVRVFENNEFWDSLEAGRNGLVVQAAVLLLEGRRCRHE